MFKINVIGDSAVGKTSLIQKYTKGSFQKEYIKTIGAQFSKYDEKIDGENFQLFLWDIAGQREFDLMRPTFFDGAKAVIIVFSEEDSEHGKKSIENIDVWLEDTRRYCGEIPVVLFGNKIDLVDDENAKDSRITEIVKKHEFLGYYKTSAKTGSGVLTAFHAIIKEIYARIKK